MSMVERVARAIAQADERNGWPPYEHRITLGKHSKEQLFDAARAAIEAMREPTEAMMEGVDCGGEKKEWLSGRMHMASWQTMIDAALKP